MRMMLDRLSAQLAHFRIDLSDITVAPGEIVALIGGNGSGKSTVIDAVLGLRPELEIKGELLGNTFDLVHSQPQLRQHLGALPQTYVFAPAMRVGEVIDLHRSLYGKGDEGLVDQLGLTDLVANRVDRLSGGQLRRLGLYVALGHDPDLVVLDEAGAALDARFAGNFLNLMRDVKARGKSVLMATHGPQELTLADRIVWLDQGQKRFDGSLPDLIDQYLGAAKGQAELPESAGAIALPSARHLYQPVPGSVIAFGDAAMEDDFLKAVHDAGALSYGFGGTNAHDVLDLVSGRMEGAGS